MDDLYIILQRSDKPVKTELEGKHCHTEYEFVFLIEGSVTIQIDSNIYEVKSPSVIIVSPFETHQIINATDNYKRIILVLNATELEKNTPPKITAVLKCRPIGYKPVIYPTKKEFDRIVATLDQIECENIAYYNDYVRNEIHNLLILICRIQGKNLSVDTEMIEIQTYIDLNYDKIDNLQEIVEKFYISQSHFSRAFKEYSGYCPLQYLINTRIYKAQELLKNTNMRVNEISREVGFKNYNNFIKQFKAKLGMTPNNYRNINRTND